MVASDVGRAVLACVRPADENGGFLSASAAASEAEQLQALRMQQSTGTQLAVKIPGAGADRAGRAVLACVRPANGDDEFSGWQRPGPCRAELCGRRNPGGRGLADGIAGREDERPLPGWLAAPGTVPCRVPFLAFLIHQRSAPHSAGGGQSWRSWPGAWATPRSRRCPRGGAAPRPPVRARGHSALPRNA